MLNVQLVLCGLCVGLVSGVMGIGGGIILIPILMLLFGFTQQEAQGTSLAALTPPVFIFAALVYYKYGFVRLPVAACVAVGLMIGAYCGARFVPKLPVDWLRLAFGALLLYVGLRYIFGIYLPRYAAAMPAGIALLFAMIGAWLRGKRMAADAKLLPLDGHTEYHI